MNFLEDLPHPQKRAIEMVLATASEKTCHPYLVGGPVRDRLLGRESIDLDLALEEGGSVLARALAKRINGRVRSFPQFLTYKVVAEGYPDIDIATTRKERYRVPGALPAVTAGKLRDDLLRRDFTVNAIALDLTNQALHDPAGGVEDVAARLIRVLHDRSFIDDPTRIFRAVRLATRLDFKIEPQTTALIEDAIANEALSTVSRERIWRELFFTMEEPEAPAIFVALGTLGALESLFGHRIPSDLHVRLSAAQREIDRDPALDREVIYTGVLLRGDASPVDFEGSGFSQKRARAVIEIANEIPRVEESLERAAGESEKFRLYRKLSPEMLAVLGCELSEELPSILRFRDFERFTLPVRGNDLDVPPGPHVAAALERTREAVFGGEITAEQARAFARETAKRLYQASRDSDAGEPPAEVATG